MLTIWEKKKYGIWLTLLSFFTWFSVLEVGVSNSFRNNLTKFFTKSDIKNSKITITKTYRAVAIIYVFVSVLLIGSSLILPIDQLFLPDNYVALNFVMAFCVSSLLFMLYYIAFTLNTILLSTHYAKLTYIISAIQSLLTLGGIYVFLCFDIEPSFTLIFAWFSGIPLLVWLTANLIVFKTLLKDMAPSVSALFAKKVDKRMRINWSFFVIQLCTLVIFSTDNLIIINTLTGTEVLKYNVAFKYFNILIVVFNLVLVPYWSSFTEAATLKNKMWIKQHIKKLLLFWLGLVIAGAFLLIFSQLAYKFWIGKDLFISNALSIFMAISLLLTSWNSIFAYFLNAVSETKWQMIILIFSASINIPLSFYFIDIFQTKGVIIATCIALFPLSIALPIQYRTVIKSIT